MQMSSHTRDKQSAHKMATLAKLAVLVSASGAVAAGFAMGRFEPNEIGEGPVVDPNAAADAMDPPPQAPQIVVVDNTTVDELLGSLSNAPVPQNEPDDAVGDAGDNLPPPTTREVRYIGTVRSGGRAAAFLNIAGVTKLLRPGQSYDGVELVSVEGDEITVNVDGVEGQRLERSERTASAVTVVSGGAPADAPKTIAGEALTPDPEFEGEMSRDERRQQLLDRARSERSRWQRDRGGRD
jgi:hypothetical protein